MRLFPSHESCIRRILKRWCDGTEEDVDRLMARQIKGLAGLSIQEALDQGMGYFALETVEILDRWVFGPERGEGYPAIPTYPWWHPRRWFNGPSY